MTTKDTVTIPGRADGVSLTFTRASDPAEEARRLEVQRELGKFRAKYGRAEGDRNAVGMLIDLALHSASTEGVDWILDAAMDADPNRALAVLRRAEQVGVEALLWKAEQEAERRDREELEQAAIRERVEARRARWARWLATVGRDALASWQPTETIPERSGGTWWAVNRGNVVGVGPTPGAAHRDANRWAFERLADPVEAADTFDDPEDLTTEGLPDFVFTEADLQFLYVEGSDPNLAAELGLDLTRTPL